MSLRRLLAPLRKLDIRHCPNCHNEYFVEWLRGWLAKWDRCPRCHHRTRPATEEEIDRVVFLEASRIENPRK